MINIIFYPNMFLALLLIGWAFFLYSLRFFKPQITREYDIVLSTIASVCGGVLAFQGWRLDPLLFTIYCLLVAALFAFSFELLQLRTLQVEASTISSTDLKPKEPEVNTSDLEMPTQDDDLWISEITIIDPRDPKKEIGLD